MQDIERLIQNLFNEVSVSENSNVTVCEAVLKEYDAEQPMLEGPGKPLRMIAWDRT